MRVRLPVHFAREYLSSLNTDRRLDLASSPAWTRPFRKRLTTGSTSSIYRSFKASVSGPHGFRKNLPPAVRHAATASAAMTGPDAKAMPRLAVIGAILSAPPAVPAPPQRVAPPPLPLPLLLPVVIVPPVPVVRAAPRAVRPVASVRVSRVVATRAAPVAIAVMAPAVRLADVPISAARRASRPRLRWRLHCFHACQGQLQRCR